MAKKKRSSAWKNNQHRIAGGSLRMQPMRGTLSAAIDTPAGRICTKNIECDKTPQPITNFSRRALIYDSVCKKCRAKEHRDRLARKRDDGIF